MSGMERLVLERADDGAEVGIVQGTAANSMLKFLGFNWDLVPNFVALVILLFCSSAAGYVTILYLKHNRQMRK